MLSLLSQDTIVQLERAAEAAPAAERPEILRQLEEVKRTYNKMAKVDKLARSSL